MNPSRFPTLATACFTAWIAIASFASGLLAADATTPAATMIPADTQAFILFPNSEKFFSDWDKTQMGILAKDARLDQFWKTQRDEIQHRFSEAGWQLSLTIEDIQKIAGGQTAIAWISRPDDPKKPFSIAVVMDVIGKTAEAEAFLKRVDSEMKQNKATVKTQLVSGVTVTEYGLVPVKGEIRTKETFYALSNNQLLAADDLVSITELIKAQSTPRNDSLATAEAYRKIQTKVANEQDIPEMQYFVRPIGLAKLLRAISGKVVGNQADILKILDNQGFGGIEAAGGHFQLAFEKYDLFHNGFVLVKTPLSGSAQILNFPNAEQLVAPNWINKHTASCLGFSWNLKDSFPHFEGIVDEYIGAGTFRDVIKGIKNDPNGPQIDIVKEVIPRVSNEFFVVTDITQPITPDSKRSMIVAQLNDPQNALPKVLDRFGKNEPNATAEDYEGFRIYRVSNEEDDSDTIEGLDTKKDDDFGVKKPVRSAKTDTNAEPAGNENTQQQKALLNQWAVSIVGKYFIFASDAEMIKDAIRNFKNANPTKSFWSNDEVITVKKIIDELNVDGRSFIQFDIGARSFEMQYELFRQGTLSENRSMMATLLDRLLKPRQQKLNAQPKINGAALPPFNQIAGYFTASGSIIKTEEDGLAIKGFVLSK